MKAARQATHKYSPADIREMVDYVRDGNTYSAAARHFGCNILTIRYWCQRHGVKSPALRGRPAVAQQLPPTPARPAPNRLTAGRIAAIHAEIDRACRPAPPPSRADTQSRIRATLRSWPPRRHPAD